MHETADTRPSPRRPHLQTMLVAGVALALRLLYLLDAADAPTFALPIVDAGGYFRAAATLASGGGFTEAFFYQPFFYPFFLAAIFKVFGQSVVAAKVVQALLGAVACGLLSHLGSRKLGCRIGLIAGLIMAVYPPLIFFEAELLATGLACFWAVVLMWLLCRVAEKATAPWLLALGATAALAVLTRPTFAPFLAAALVWLALRWRGSPRQLGQRFAMIVVAAVLVLAPVAGLSHRTTGKASILPSSAGLNLYLGNNPDRCATLTLRPGREWRDLMGEPARAGARSIWEENAYFKAKAQSWVLGHPAAAVRGYFAKIVELISSREVPRNVDIYLFREWSLLLRAGVWKLGGFGFPFGLLLMLAVLGVVLEARRAPIPVLLLAATYPLAVALVFASARYRMPLVPALVLLAALGIDGLVVRLRSPRPRSLLPAGAAVAATLAAAVLPGPFCQEQDLRPEHFYLVGAEHLRYGQVDEAVPFLARAVALDPAYLEAHFALATCRVESGDLAAAADSFRTAAELEPERPEAWWELARVTLSMGRMEEGIAALGRVVEANPNDTDALVNLGAALMHVGQTERAAACFERTLELDPDNLTARRNLEALRR